MQELEKACLEVKDASDALKATFRIDGDFSVEDGLRVGFQQAFWGDNGIKATMTRRTPVSYPYLAGLPSDSQRRDSLDRMVKAVRTSFVERIQKQVPENVIRPPSSISSFKFSLVKTWECYLGFCSRKFPDNHTLGFVASFFPYQNFAF